MKQQAEILSSLTDLFNKIDFYYRPQMEAVFPDLSLSELESIELIAKLPQPNVTRLSDQLYVTRGAISKVTKKLLRKGLIERYQLPENKKEIYFRLSDSGKKINNLHEAMHQKFLEKDQAVFADLTNETAQIILDFLDNYNAHLDRVLRNSQK